MNSDQVLPLSDIRVVELTDRWGEFCGRLLAGMGAEVIKVEPPGGARSRRIGPFYECEPGPERSLHFWQYNLGKQGVILDLETAVGRDLLRRLIATADVVLESYSPGYLDGLDLGYSSFVTRHSSLVWLSITDFGAEGPYRDWASTDLVQLALGGQMMVSGYAPEEDGYDTPPIAPQMNQADHIASDQAATDILAALCERDESGRGQHIDFSVHSAVNLCTENHLAWYIVGRRIAARGPQYPTVYSRDGVPIVTMGTNFAGEWERLAEMLAEDADLRYVLEPEFADPARRALVEVADRLLAAKRAWAGRRDAEEIFRHAQARGVVWAPVRKPHASLADEHFRLRGTFAEVPHPELDRAFTYAAQPWVSEAMPWRAGPRAPLLGEHNEEVLGPLR